MDVLDQEEQCQKGTNQQGNRSWRKKDFESYSRDEARDKRHEESNDNRNDGRQEP